MGPETAGRPLARGCLEMENSRASTCPAALGEIDIGDVSGRGLGPRPHYHDSWDPAQLMPWARPDPALGRFDLQYFSVLTDHSMKSLFFTTIFSRPAPVGWESSLVIFWMALILRGRVKRLMKPVASPWV